MTARVTMDQIIELVQKVGLENYLSFQRGKSIVYALVHPRTLFTLYVWADGDGVQGYFKRETESHLQTLAFKKYVVQVGATMPDAQRKARDHFQEFTGGTDGTTQTGD